MRRGRYAGGWAPVRGAVAAVALALSAGLSVAAQRDVRGLRTGMTVTEAEAAAAAHGLRCDTSFTGRTTCGDGDTSVVLVTTGRGSDLVWELQVSLAGRYEPDAMLRRLTATYGLVPTAVPQVYATAAGEELFLLEIGGTATVFYLRDPAVLRGTRAPLPPPKL